MSTALRLRTDAYYVPVPTGVWIRTTDGSFTLRGRSVATWIERLAPMLDRGVVPEELTGALQPEQAEFVKHLLDILEQHGVLVARPDYDVPDGSPLSRVFPQQVEFLRHLVTEPAPAMERLRRYPLAVVGNGDRAGQLAAALMETGFGDITLLDAEPGPELVDLADSFREREVPVSLRGPEEADPRGRALVGVFAPAESNEAWYFLDRAAAAGSAAWVGLTRGQAMLLKGQVPGSGQACARCAWRRLVHTAVGLPESDDLGFVPVAVAATVIAQEMFQYVACEDGSVLDEGVVVDLTRLSVWRTAIDPAPECPSDDVHPETPDPAPRRHTEFPESIFGARCFGPLVSCVPGDLPQSPLAALSMRYNPPGRDHPISAGTEVLVVGETVPEARAEAALIAVEATLPSEGETVAVGASSDEALVRAALRWADTALEGADQDAKVWQHKSGLWQAKVEDVVRTGLDPDQAQHRAELAARGREQLAGRGPAELVTAWSGAVPDRARVDEVLSRLGLTWREACPPPLVGSGLAAVVVKAKD